MPIARRRRLDNRVRYVVTTYHVRPRDDVEGDDYEDSDDEPPTPVTTMAPAPVSTQAPTPTTQEKALASSSKEHDHEDGRKITSTPILSRVPTTTTATATALPAEESDLAQTAFVTILPPPPPPPPPPPHKGGLSQTTEHLLIAAGSIGATIVLILIFYAFYAMKKRGLTIWHVFHSLRHRRRSPRSPQPQAAVQNWTTPANVWGRSQPFDHGSMKDLPTMPRPVFRRNGSNDSQNPFSDAQSTDRQPNALQNGRSGSRPLERSFLLDSPPRATTRSPSRNAPSITPSSPVLPLQTERQSASTHNTRSLSDASTSLAYPVAMPGDLSLDAAPTFRQFLFNRSASNPGPKPLIAPAPPMISRFSWTNSAGAQTPMPPQTPARSSTMPGTATSAATPHLPRDSVATSRSSVPRFRTIDSWVSQQASRVEEQRLREQIRTQGSAFLDADDDEKTIPDVPLLPKNVANLRTSNGIGSGPAVGRNKSVQKREKGHQRRDTATTLASERTISVFRQHPGTEVRMSTRSLVPSEVFNSKIRSSVL